MAMIHKRFASLNVVNYNFHFDAVRVKFIRWLNPELVFWLCLNFGNQSEIDGAV